VFCASCIEASKRKKAGECPLCKQPPGNLIRLRGTASQLPVPQLAEEHARLDERQQQLAELVQQLAGQARQLAQQLAGQARQQQVIAQLRENLQREKDKLAQQQRQLNKHHNSSSDNSTAKQ
jgi:hypothetical protein